MKFATTMMVLLFLNGAFAVSEKINGKFAYYGEDFYQKLASKTVTKETIGRVLSNSHSAVKGQFDSVGACVATCYRHTSVGYDTARKILFGEIYVQRDSEGTYVQDVYCGKKFHFRRVEEASSMHAQVNIEHTWPQSKFTGMFEKGMQKSDMHHLYLTDSLANNRRGNHEFGNTDGAVDELNVDDCDESKLARDHGDMVFQPPTLHRGNVARALFYFATRYNMTISSDQEKALREWHKADPVDEEERRRTEIVAGYQKVRNPFVDHPELIDIIRDL